MPVLRLEQWSVSVEEVAILPVTHHPQALYWQSSLSLPGGQWFLLCCWHAPQHVRGGVGLVGGQLSEDGSHF